MKHCLLALVAALILLPSCSNSNSNEPTDYVDVTVAFTGLDITITPEDAPHRKPAKDTTATGVGVKRLALKVFNTSGTTVIKDTIQNRYIDSINFGKPITLRIPVGSYKFVAVAHSTKQETDPTAVINSATEVSFGSGLVNNPTYTTVQDVTVSGNTTQAVSIDFGTRKNAVFAIYITDATPSDVNSLEMIVNPNGSVYEDLLVDPSTGFASDAWRYKRTITNSEKQKGTFSKLNWVLPLFLTTTSATFDVTINALDANGSVLYTRTLNNVSFQQGYRTRAKGTVFSSNTTSTFVFDDTEETNTISLD